MQAKVAVFTFPSSVFESNDLSRFVYTDTVRKLLKYWLPVLHADNASQFLDAQPFQNGAYQWDMPQMLWAMVSSLLFIHVTFCEQTRFSLGIRLLCVPRHSLFCADNLR